MATKRTLLTIAIVCVLMLGLTPLAYAIGWTPTEDATGYATTASDDSELRAVSSGAGACVVTATSYMKFDLSSVTLSIGSARLLLKLTRVNAGSGSARLALWSVTDDTWTESSVRADSPALVSEVAAVTFAAGAQPAAGGQVIFESSSTGDKRLVDFLNSQVSNDPDRLASLALRVTECGTGLYEYRVASSENDDTAARPSLEIYTPTAVGLSTVVGQAASAAIWPFYAGLAVLGLLAALAVNLSRRRTVPR